ncbi:MAG TPA: hypothetical protein VFC19_37850 [Candidatus Limnocylindrales bacterium]|nr:hypothetical protein [Candidatus Limnocylindrales bacterium]
MVIGFDRPLTDLAAQVLGLDNGSIPSTMDGDFVWIVKATDLDDVPTDAVRSVLG